MSDSGRPMGLCQHGNPRDSCLRCELAAAQAENKHLWDIVVQSYSRPHPDGSRGQEHGFMAKLGGFTTEYFPTREQAVDAVQKLIDERVETVKTT